GKKLEYVKIDVDSGSYMIKTNPDGTFNMKIPQGTHNIRASKPGYIGFIRQEFNINKDTTFNISMPDTIQESPDSTQKINIGEYKELNRGDNTLYSNGKTWNGVTEGNLIPVYLNNATSFDSLTFKNAIGLETNWENSHPN
ncbi:MAG: hypothetical protein M0R68_15090, partial [Bacteroidetes bacterium]|nr:hypothetical protein [Bacteroidota bacterium]